LDFANELAIVGVASRVAECKPVLFYVLLEVHLKANFNSPFLCFFLINNKFFVPIIGNSITQTKGSSVLIQSFYLLDL